MLKLEKFLGKGTNRICFESPENPNQCVKISFRFKVIKPLQDELNNYLKVKPIMQEFILNYETELVETNFGKGLVCDLLHDDNDEKSKTLEDYVMSGQLENEIKMQIKAFGQHIINNNIFFYDFNLSNFVIQIKNGKKQLKYIDLKSLNRYKPWTYLHLEKIIKPLARLIMKKRLRQFFNSLDIKVEEKFWK